MLKKLKMSENKKFDYERHIWGKPGYVIDLHDKRNSTLALRRFLESIDNINGCLLEVGCGTGMFVRSVQRYRPDLETYGCDISQKAISMAGQDKKYPICYEVADAASLPYEGNNFDVVVMADVLEHLENVKETLKECLRVLKEEGVLHLTVPCEANIFTLHWLMWKAKIGHNLKREYAGHIQRFTAGKIYDLLREEKLTIIQRTFSFHLLGQIYDIFFDYLPRKFAKERKVDSCKKQDLSVKERVFRSFKERGVPLTIWLMLGRLVDRAAFYESQILKKFPLAMTVHIACKKEGGV